MRLPYYGAHGMTDHCDPIQAEGREEGDHVVVHQLE
jgi:hypothetical protein